MRKFNMNEGNEHKEYKRITAIIDGSRHDLTDAELDLIASCDQGAITTIFAGCENIADIKAVCGNYCKIVEN